MRSSFLYRRIQVGTKSTQKFPTWLDHLPLKPFYGIHLFQVGTTVIIHSAFLSAHSAVIVVVPAFRALTVPFSTDAMSGLDEVQVMALSVASADVMVAVKVAVSPRAIDSSVLSREMDSVSTGTVMIHSAEQDPAVAVMVAILFAKTERMCISANKFVCRKNGMTQDISPIKLDLIDVAESYKESLCGR
jgi:hypothetical protein